MRSLCLLFLWIPLLLRAGAGASLSDDEDLSLYHNVNVISGHLNLHFQDAVVEGAIPLPLLRTYSSEGALLPTEDNQDCELRNMLGEWCIQGGWNFMPHLFLLYDEGGDSRPPEIFLAEKSGAVIAYVRESSEKGIDQFKPKDVPGACSGVIGARTNAGNNCIKVNFYKGEAVLYLPDGGERKYKRPSGVQGYFRLVEEILPSKHVIAYHHSWKNGLISIQLKTPSKERSLSWLNLKMIKRGDGTRHFHFEATSSDGKSLHYRSRNHESRNYLDDVRSNCRPLEKLHFEPSRKGKGLRLHELDLGGQMQLMVNYYGPTSRKEERKWAEDPEKKPLEIDRVKSIEGPIGPNGEVITIAHFKYHKGATEVIDCEGVRTVYHHADRRLSRVDYYDERQRHESSLHLIWEGQNLIGKVMFNNLGEPLFSRTFSYDAYGNVTEEKFWGNLTGAAKGPFFMTPKGELEGAESYYKRYRYLPVFNVPTYEEEQDGTSCHYAYLPNTDLVVFKLMSDHDKVITRQFFYYDADHFLVKEITDDGCSEDPNNLTQVTERSIKAYGIDCATGMRASVVESYWKNGEEHPLSKVEYHYSPQQRVDEERVYDAEGNYRYTLRTEYDNQGRVALKTTPLGYVNTYRYSVHGNLMESKEVGSLKKVYTYTPSGSPLSCEEWDDEGLVKITKNVYDAKGRLISQTDGRGNETLQKYDSFGKCIETEFPLVQNPDEMASHPILKFSYDAFGYLAQATAPCGEITQTHYNAYGKPIKMIHPDGSCTQHTYSVGNALLETIYPDGGRVVYTYDRLQRKTGEAVYSPGGEILRQELWDYNAFHLLSHTDPLGLVTFYTYDGAGRLVEENASGRIKRYTYDALGHMQTATAGPVTKVTLCDEEGRVIETWEEDDTLARENHMTFSYDRENRKRRATRVTSVGVAVDLFDYDAESRLCKHTDPEGHVTEFIYDETFQNALGQRVLQKTTIDPLGNRKIETYDALGRLARIENQSPQCATVAEEEYSYDLSGNRTKRTTSIYDQDRLVRKIATIWKHDAMGRVLKEVESGERTTLFTYDAAGRVKTKTLNSKVVISYDYDGLGRMREQKSSDGTIHYTYLYEEGMEPTEIIDHKQNLNLKRRYNHFGQLIEETNPHGLMYRWDYDDFGRCFSFTLPDQSRVGYDHTGRHISAVTRYSSRDAPQYSHRYTHFDPNGHVQEEELIASLGAVKTQRDLLERLSEQHSRLLNVSQHYGPSGLVTSTCNSLFGSKKYDYDPLGQLVQEGQQSYFFDSIGNPSLWEVNNCNRILSTPECTLRYDPDGNPKGRTSGRKETTYDYDALGRLIRMETSDKIIFYTYDPLSRLLSKETKSKWWGGSKVFYLYDKEYEIGTISPNNEIQQLKVLGLGLKGDIGAAVAIEIKGAIYAPLHDFNGNILAIITSAGKIAKTYQMDAFGKQKGDPDELNPWQFCSKRCEENLVFFGLRFYDPSLGRWLTPDPSGFAEGPNLYLYALNSPTNRLDLFGLKSIDSYTWYTDPDAKIDIQIEKIYSSPTARDLIHCKGTIDGVHVDFIVACGHWEKLKYSAEELNEGKINILDHIRELMPKEGSMVGLITAQNGINTSFNEFRRSCKSLMRENKEGALFIGLYNRTEGFIKDLLRVMDERRGVETSAVLTTRHFLENMGERLQQMCPGTLSMHFSHSEGGMIAYLALKGMNPDTKAVMQKQMISYALGPAHPIPSEYCFKAENYYSKKDYITGRFGREHMNDPAYDIQWADCTSTIKQRTGYIADHAMLGNTYFSTYEKCMRISNDKYGHYNGMDR